MPHVHRRPPPEPGRQEPRQPPALPAAGQGAGAARRCGTAPAERGIRDMEEGGEISHPRDGVREPRFRRSARAASASTCCRATRNSWKATPSRGRRAAEAAAARKAPGRRRRGRFPLRPVAGRVPQTCSSTTSNCPIWPSAGWSRHRSRRLAPGRLFGRGVAGEPRADAHDAQQPVAAHRAEAAEAATRSRRWRREIAALEDSAATTRTRLTLLRERAGVAAAGAAARIPYIDPIDLRYRQYEPVSAARSRRR